MKHTLPLAITLLALLACTNGKNPQGTPVDTDTLPERETVATLNPNAQPNEATSIDKSACFENLFRAEVDNQGVVRCLFCNIDDDLFPQIFNQEGCPTDTIALKAGGSVKGLSILNEGSGVDPALFLLMDDNHAERISLWELSCGKDATIFRSEQGGITMFENYEEQREDWEGEMVVGIDAEGNRIMLDWNAR